jgi:glycine betaine/proline transport system ATP-binding protein
MQQRVGLARAFATNADLLLMDEPFSALDPLIRTKLQDELLALQKNLRKTILFVSHDLDEAMKIGNKIAIMEGGRIVQSGTPEEIILKPANAYVAEFVAHMNPMNVLKVSSIMRPLDECLRHGANFFLDAKRTVELTVTANETPALAQFDGKPISLRPYNSEDIVSAGRIDGIVVIPKGIPMRNVIDLRSRSEFPLIVIDEAGRFAGVCDDAEIYSALLR